MQDTIQRSPKNPIDQVIIQLLEQSPEGLSAQDILIQLANQAILISQPTLSRHLAHLRAGRQIKSRRQGRSIIYQGDSYRTWFSTPPTQRPKVSYNSRFLEEYQPNVTHWFSTAEIENLMKAGGHQTLDASTYSRAIVQKLLVDLSYASSALEGNTYSYLDTQVLIEFGKIAPGKTVEETQMVLNHKDAINYLVDHIQEINASTRELKTLHALLARGLLEPLAVGGIRKIPVDIGGSSYIPLAIPQKLDEEFERMALKAVEINNPFEQSFFLLVFISYVQVFKDVNKRTARLACNIPLLKNGFSPFSFVEMDKTQYIQGLLSIYELNRIDPLKEAYLNAYIASAVRYSTYTARDKTDIEFEYRYRQLLYDGVRIYVEKCVKDQKWIDANEFVTACFIHQPTTIRETMIKKTVEIIDGLHEGNHIAYGISKENFYAYQKLKKRESF